jgi:hypothetical protein
MKRNHRRALKAVNAGVAVTLLFPCCAKPGFPAGAASANQSNELIQSGQPAVVTSKFYCNLKALSPDERARQQKLTAKLIAVRSAVIETDKGYEFQYTPAQVTLAELADWAAAESKCCSFFDFHIDLEKEGQLICLRLTGEPRIKNFIRAEFQVPK